MAGAELVADLAIILGRCVHILDQQRDGRAGGQLLRHALVLEHAGENSYRVRLLALGDEFATAPAGAGPGQLWMSASVSAMPGGQPSTTQPIAGPWLSPKVVTRNRWPKVLCDMRVCRNCAANPSIRSGS